MFKKTAASLFLFVFFLPAFAGAEGPSLSFTDKDKVLVIAPHPDDEALGAGGILQSAKAANAEVRVVYLTNG